MNAPENFDALVLGGGTAGKLAAWTMAKEGRRTAVVDRKYIGGSCPEHCLPAEQECHLFRQGRLARGEAAGVRDRDRADRHRHGGSLRAQARNGGRHYPGSSGQISRGLDKDRGDELIFGEGTFVAPRTVHVALRDGGERTLTADRVFVNLGSRATIPDTPGLREAKPLTHIEALDLQRRPEHLIVLGGGYVGLELSQALRRLGSRVTLISRDSQLASNEDADVSLGDSAAVPGRRHRCAVRHATCSVSVAFRATT